MKRHPTHLSSGNLASQAQSRYWLRTRLRSMGAVVLSIGLICLGGGFLADSNPGRLFGWPAGLIILSVGLPLAILLILLRASAMQSALDWHYEMDQTLSHDRWKRAKVATGFPVAMPDGHGHSSADTDMSGDSRPGGESGGESGLGDQPANDATVLQKQEHS